MSQRTPFGFTGPAGPTGSGTYLSGVAGPMGATGPMGPRGPAGPKRKVLLSRPVPGHRDFHLTASFSVEGFHLSVETGPEWEPRSVRKVAAVTDGRLGFDVGPAGPRRAEYEPPVPRESMTDPQRLCYEVMKADVTNMGGPRCEDVWADGFWERFVSDIAGLDLVAEVLLT